MHACITAYSLDIPVVGLIWNDKLTRFAELTNQRHMFFNETEINVENIYARLVSTDKFQFDQKLKADLKKRTQIEIDAFLETL